MRPQVTREQWLAGLRALLEPVGQCIEWQGRYNLGKTPLVYVPRGYAWRGNSQGGQSVRVVLFALHHGRRPLPGQVLRTQCHNGRCVSVDHFMVISRRTQAAEQGRRGELSTPRRRAARLRCGRATAKLNSEAARAIRASTLPARELAPLYGVSRSTIDAVRRGRLWPAVLTGASVFGWQGG